MKRKEVFLLGFMGQSNMAGRGNAQEAPALIPGAGYEYRAITAPDCLSPLEEPFGENENDEEIEREGMANLIDWEKYGVQLVGTAWNGIEGLKKIREFAPDIVLTDIKMPGMDGIELIKKTREEMPWVEFVILSGYGEFAYTSKAMEQGIRYYLMKPCDEYQIQEVLEKVKKQIQDKCSMKKQEEEYRNTVERLLPKAREQLFRDMIFGEAFREADFRLFAAEHDVQHIQVRLMAFSRETGFDYLEQFILQNMFREQIGFSYVLLFAYVRNQMVFMLDEQADKMEESARMVRDELGKRSSVPIFTALSEKGKINDVGALYLQIEELFRMGQAENITELLSCSYFSRARGLMGAVVDFSLFRDAFDEAGLFREVYFTFLKMKRKKYSLVQMTETSNWIVKVLYGKSLPKAAGENKEAGEILLGKLGENVQEAAQERGLCVRTACFLAECKGFMQGKDKEQQRMKEMLVATFYYFDCQTLNLRFLAKNVLYRNEEYLSRVFQRVMHSKYSAWLIEQRVEMAKRLLQFEPEMRIASLAELVGYSPDGQYFSKIFHKTTGMTPAEYRGSCCPRQD